MKAAEKKKIRKYMSFSSYLQNISCYVMSEVSLKRSYFALFNDGLTLKLWNWRISVFAFKLFESFSF